MTGSLPDDLTNADFSQIPWKITGGAKSVTVDYTNQGRCATVRYAIDGTPLDASVDGQPLPGNVIRSGHRPQGPVRILHNSRHPVAT